MSLLRRLTAGIALVVAPLALMWAGSLYLFGGFHLSFLGVRITAHDVWRPLFVAVAAGVVYVWLSGVSHVRNRIVQIVQQLQRSWPQFLAGILAAAVVAAGVRWMSLTAGGADSYGYVSEAEMWRRGELVIEQPWAAAVPWPNADRSFAPLGYHPGPRPHTIAPTYSPGLPMLMALAKSVAGQCGVFYIVPLSAGLAVLATFALGRRLTTPAGGLAAAWLLATSPVFLFMLMSPMSDVPTAAAWAVAFWCAALSSRMGAVSSGLAAAMAVLLRPNLAPMSLLIPAWHVAMAWRGAAGRHLIGRRHLLAAGIVGGMLALAFAAVAALNQLWNGLPMQSGYGSFGELFSWGYIKLNVVSYAAWFAETQTPVEFVGIAAILLPMRWLWPGQMRSLVLVTGLFVFIVWFEYCAYFPFEAWWYLRFLLPCWPFIMIGVGAVAVGLARQFRSRWIRAAIVVTVITLGGIGLYQSIHDGFLFGTRRGENKYPAIAEILRRRTDASAIVLSGQHSGSVRYYGGRMTMTFFNLDREWLDRAVEWLAAHGTHPYALLEDWEVDEFRARFAAANVLGRLEMTPIVEYVGGPTIYIFDLLPPRDSSRSPERLEEVPLTAECHRPAPPPTVHFRN